MGWLTKLKEKAQEHTILGLFALIGLLSLIVWRAVPSEVWDKVSEVTPKRALWALLALTAIAAILEGAYILLLRKRLAEKLTTKFGVKWTKDLLPHCPSCSSALTNYGHYWNGAFTATWSFTCVKCNQRITMSDEAGNALELHEAKDLIAAKLNQQPHMHYVVDHKQEEILVRLSEGSATADEITRLLGLHHERVEDTLNRLEGERYIQALRTFLGTGSPAKYRLADRGRQFLINKGRI
jgi:hypothetical protein